MQERNSSSSPCPKPKDGTQTVSTGRQDANWFGASQEPQEEYVENSPEFTEARETATLSEGEPTFGNHAERESATKKPAK